MVVTEVTFTAEDGRIAHFLNKPHSATSASANIQTGRWAVLGTLRGSRYYLWGML